jgi:excinuclease ABC subunit C
MHETLTRRLSEKNIKAWGKPSLVLIDGGKGQLDAAIRARDEQGQEQIPFIGLAKREEQIVIQKDDERRTIATDGSSPLGMSGVKLNMETLHKLGGFISESDDFILVNIPHNTNLIKLLQRIRDESHRFAVTYHSVLKVKRQTASALDEIPGVGPATRKKLLRIFGSFKGISEANEAELAKVLGVKKAHTVAQHLLTPNLVR